MIPETLPLAVLLVHLAATLYMLGLVWFVQWVHYPLFAAVGANGFGVYEREHVVRTGPVVGPAMLLEAGTGLALVALPPAGLPTLGSWLGLALLGVIWLSTLVFQIPCHRDLEHHFDAGTHRRLVSTNWIRTAAWSLRSVLVLWMVFQVAAGASS